MTINDNNSIQEILDAIFGTDLNCSIYNKIKSQKLLLENRTKQSRILTDGYSQLVVLKEFGSFSPLISNGKGGGYFLILDGKGIVIDPGHNYLSNFQNEGYFIGDIDTIIVTHAHDDHTADLEPLVTLMYQRYKNKFWPKGKKVNVYMNKSSYQKYEWLTKTKRPYLNIQYNLIPNKKIVLNGTKIIPVKSKHQESEFKNLENDAVGLIFKTPNCIIVFSSDTGWDENFINLYKEAIGCQLLVLHIGSILEKEKNYFTENMDPNYLYDNHLGIIGVCKFINYLHPRCTIISEFGEEMSNFTDAIVSIIKKNLNIECFAGNLGFKYIV